MHSIEKQLLNQTITFIKRAEEISRLKGESFNIFNVLNLESDEVRLHNKFLAELLNPKGTHQQGGIFLNLFYDYLLNSDKLSLPDSKKQIVKLMKSSTSRVVNGYWLGNKNRADTSGGSVDICIISPFGQIRIENKIYAGDQETQIARYCYNHNDEKNIVIYWNRFGDQPSQKSRSKMKKGNDYFILSHHTDTLKWLDRCIKEASNFPILRETIKQYHLLIQKLTYQNQSSHMKKDLINLLLENKENYLAAKNIAEHLTQAREFVYKNVLDSLDSIFSTEQLAKMERPRSMRHDGGFIPLIQLIQNEKTFDVGINIELDNNYCFFCVIEAGKNRNYTGINKSEHFNHLSQFLSSKDYLVRKANTRTGWSLSGTYNFSNRFSFLHYLELSDSDRKELIMGIAKEILSVIHSSQLKTYHSLISLQSVDN